MAGARPVEGEDVEARRDQAVSQRFHHVERVAGRAMQQDDEAAPLARRAPFEDVQAPPFDRNETPARRKRPRDGGRAQSGEERERDEERRDGGEDEAQMSRPSTLTFSVSTSFLMPSCSG